MLPVIYQWSVVMASVLWPVVAGDQPPMDKTYEVPLPDFIRLHNVALDARPLEHKQVSPKLANAAKLLAECRRLELEELAYQVGGRLFRQLPSGVKTSLASPKLANAAKILAECRRFQLKELAEKFGEFRQLLRGEKTSLADSATWLNQEALPGWITFEEFIVLFGGGPLVKEDSEEAEEDNFEGSRCHDRSKVFLAEHDITLGNLVQLSPRDKVTSLQDQFAGFLGMNVKELLERSALSQNDEPQFRELRY